jgi:hypothetical protein
LQRAFFREIAVRLLSTDEKAGSPRKERALQILAAPREILGTPGGTRTKYLEVSKAHRPEQEQRRVNVDFPIWMIQSLDKEAKRLGVPRPSIIEVWVAERLEKMKAS